MRGGGFLLALGIGMIIWGGLLAFFGPFALGFGICVLGAFAAGTGVILVIDPRDSIEREVDRWDESWTSRYAPGCPVHGEHLCITRTRRCPGARERVS